MAVGNGVMLQGFHWYCRGDGGHWGEMAARADELARAGFTAVWLPPACKGHHGAADVGYGVYDMYDLGEFDQKGSVRTKYGTRADYLTAVAALRRAGLQVYADVVLNHRLGADHTELVRATPYAADNRRHPQGEPREIEAYTHFGFPGRAGRYSEFQWHARHFDAVDYDARQPDQRGTVYVLEGKQFDSQVALELGNFAFLMGADVDFESDEVRQEMIAWGRWLLDTTPVDGFRLDAIKHISAWFFPQWLDQMEAHAGRDLTVIGEYWSADLGALHWYLDQMGGRMSVFDVPLHFRFYDASRGAGNYDLRQLFDNTLLRQRSLHAVTFVDNHDSQPLQALESPVEPWFKPLAYAAILLRSEGYPCVFYPDYYGAEYEDFGRDGRRHRIVLPSLRTVLDRLLWARRHFAWGPQVEYNDHPHQIGWVRLGDDQHPGAMAVVMSDGEGGSKWMDVRRPTTRLVDVTGHIAEPVDTNREGWGEFRCQGGSVSVWVERSSVNGPMPA